MNISAFLTMFSLLPGLLNVSQSGNFTGKFVLIHIIEVFPKEEDTTPQMFQDISIAVAQIV
jgi:hypothetical protein